MPPLCSVNLVAVKVVTPNVFVGGCTVIGGNGGFVIARFVVGFGNVARNHFTEFGYRHGRCVGASAVEINFFARNGYRPIVIIADKLHTVTLTVANNNLKGGCGGVVISNFQHITRLFINGVYQFFHFNLGEVG